jgi:hypothetical protein
LKSTLGASPLLNGERGCRPCPLARQWPFRRRFAPILIAEAAIVDRFQMKSVIAFLKILRFTSKSRKGIAAARSCDGWATA